MTNKQVIATNSWTVYGNFLFYKHKIQEPVVT